MTATSPSYTPEAAARLAVYLRQVRAAVGSVADLSADDIEADITAHVAAEFASLSVPVTAGQMDAVLHRLGPPAGWAGVAGEPVSVRAVLASGRRQVRESAVGLFTGVRGLVARVFRTLWRGPEDWRLAYATVGLLLLGAVAFPLFPLFLLGSYLFARAAVALAADSGVSLGPRRWLVYPPLVLVSGALLVGLVGWAPFAAGSVYADFAWRTDFYRQVNSDEFQAETRNTQQYVLRMAGYRQAGDKSTWRLSADDTAVHEAMVKLEGAFPAVGRRPAAVLTAAAGGGLLWAMVLGLVWWTFPGAVRAVFAPFFSATTGVGGRRLFLWAAAGWLGWVVLVSRLVKAAGV